MKWALTFLVCFTCFSSEAQFSRCLAFQGAASLERAPQQAETILDFHSQTPNTQYGFIPFLDAWGHTNLWSSVEPDATPPNLTIWTNVTGPDFPLGFTVQTPDGHTAISTGTHWLHGDLTNTNGPEDLFYQWGGNTFVRMVAYLYISKGTNPTTAASKDLYLFYQNPYAVSEFAWPVGENVVPHSGVHSPIGGSGQLVADVPVQYYLQVEMVENMTNGYAFVTFRDATNHTVLFSSIFYGDPSATLQDEFRVRDGYTATFLNAYDERTFTMIQTDGQIPTNRPPWIPNAPSSITAAQSGAGQVTISWTDNNIGLNPTTLDEFTNSVYVNNIASAIAATNSIILTGRVAGDYKWRAYATFPPSTASTAKIESNTLTVTNVSNSTFILSDDGGAGNNNQNGLRGFKFQVGAANLTVTSLGMKAYSTFASGRTSVTVGLYDASCTLITSASVDTSAFDDTYKFASITPQVLTAGSTYQVLFDNSDSSDLPIACTATTTADAAVTSDVWNGCGNFIFGTAVTSQGPNFQYHE